MTHKTLECFSILSRLGLDLLNVSNNLKFQRLIIPARGLDRGGQMRKRGPALGAIFEISPIAAGLNSPESRNCQPCQIRMGDRR